jgi:hypothetical protein
MLFCSFLTTFALVVDCSLFSAQVQKITQEDSVVLQTNLGPIVKIARGNIGRVETESSIQFVLVPSLNPSYAFIYEVFKNGQSSVSKRAKIIQLGSKKSLLFETHNNDDYGYIRTDYENALKCHGAKKNITIGVVTMKQEHGVTTYSASASDGTTYVYRVVNATKKAESFALRKIQDSQTICKISKIRRKPDDFSGLPLEYEKQQKLLAQAGVKQSVSESKS